ncbi:MAG: hypothetical protein EAZ27_13010 [Cytophagales bacterium]|nr:MAG: hypothetical protein EAZ27_13010 [Cytophagales bacterium]
MNTSNIFIAHPTNIDQIKALKAVLKQFNVKFEIKKEPENNFNSISKSKILNNIKVGFQEMKDIQVGKKKGTSFKDFLNEL